MPEKLFVGGLPFDYTDDQLKALFAKAGTVLSAFMVQDPKNKRTRGFGFVTLAGKQEALAAIEMLKGMKVGEKSIYITEAREKPPAKPVKAPREFRGPLYPHPSIDERKPSFRDPRRDHRGPPRSRGPRGFRPSDAPSSFGPARDRTFRPSDRPPFRGARPDRSSFGDRRPSRPPFGDRPSFGGARPKRPFVRGPRPDRSAPSSRPSPSNRPPKKTFYSKFDKRKREE